MYALTKDHLGIHFLTIYTIIKYDWYKGVTSLGGD